jgi:hypothetical protein
MSSDDTNSLDEDVEASYNSLRHLSEIEIYSETSSTISNSERPLNLKISRFSNDEIRDKILKEFKDNIGIICLILVYFAVCFICGVTEVWVLSWKGWFVLFLIISILVALVKNVTDPGVIFLVGSTILTALEIIDIKTAVAGFSNQGMLSVAVLFIIAKGVQATSVLDIVFRRLLGTPKNLPLAQIRLLVMTPIKNNIRIIIHYSSQWQ